MIEIRDIYADPMEAERFVRQCESAFEGELNETADSIAGTPGLRCVTLFGPTCSGKTTTAAKLTAAIEKNGRRARVLSIDNFYLEKDEMEARGITDFEGPDAIDLELFKKTVSGLSAGAETCIPTFDFTLRKRAAFTRYMPDMRDIYIFEGIQAVYPEICAVLEPFGYKSVFISVQKDVSLLGEVIRKEDIRLVRRVIRDYYHRNASPEYTLSLWNNVRENEEKNILPGTQYADFALNSLLPYEVLLTGKYFIPLTDGYPENAVFCDKVSRLRRLLSMTGNTGVDVSMVPMNSVFREFIV